MFKNEFFGSDPASLTQYQSVVEKVVEALTSSLPVAPYSGLRPDELDGVLSSIPVTGEGSSFESVLPELQTIIRNSIGLWHPHVAAHLHTPVLNVALAAEMVISALNQSMDSFDQAPAATVIEQQMIRWLIQLVGFTETSSGSFTAGGTQSNYMGLLLARDEFLHQHWDWCARTDGLPPESSRLRILCSDMAHFSVEKSAIQLGLGTNAVVKVPTDHEFRMSSEALRRAIEDLLRSGLAPFAVVATAGTTDFGSIDPLRDIAAIAKCYGLWLHVDAAYGGALLLSQQNKSKLAGIQSADSVTMDFHKAFFQPISCGAFLVADARSFRHIRVTADYLNPESHEEDGIPDLVTNSVMTTRRFDALKLWLCMQVLGTNRFGEMIDRIVDLARSTATQIRTNKSLELLNQPTFGCILFRHTSGDPNINEAIARELFRTGQAVIGHTRVQGQSWLKLTLSNPCTQQSDLNSLLDKIVECGHSVQERQVEVAV